MRIRNLLTTASALAVSLGMAANVTSANELTVKQVGDNGGSVDNNLALADQNGTGNDTDVLQQGDANFARTDVTGDYNSVDAVQDGNQNTVSFGIVMPATGIGAEFRQNGDFNDADLTRVDATNGTSLYIEQNSDGNRASFIGQGRTFSGVLSVQQGGGYGNEIGGGGAGTTQVGNSAAGASAPLGYDGLTGAAYGVSFAALSAPDALIGGTNNVLAMAQDGTGNVIGLQATGDNNTLQGPGYQPGATTQPVQLADGSAPGTFSETGQAFTQAGDYNQALVLMSGGGNTLTGAQTGDLNQMQVEQYGGGQTATVIQAGNSNVVASVQGAE